MQNTYHQHRRGLRKPQARAPSWQRPAILIFILAAAICIARQLQLVEYGHGAAVYGLADVTNRVSGYPCQTEEPFSYAEWIEARYAILDPAKNAFELIEEECQGDTPLAIQEFFRLLPEYVHDLKNLDATTIHRRVEELERIPQSDSGAPAAEKVTSNQTSRQT